MAAVLIVSGNKLVGWSLKETLAQAGVPADIATTIRDAQIKIADYAFPLIIVDAEARNADGVLDQIESITSPARIILLSSLVDARPESFSRRPNIFSVIAKPFSVGQIKDAILRALSGAGFQAGRAKSPQG